MVGSSGSTTPTAPRPVNTKPNATRIQRAGPDSSGSGPSIVTGSGFLIFRLSLDSNIRALWLETDISTHYGSSLFSTILGWGVSPVNVSLNSTWLGRGGLEVRRFVISRKRVFRLSWITLFVVSCGPRLAVPGPQQLDAWVVYFDATRGMVELELHGALFDRVSLFAYELDSTGALRPAPGMAEMVAPFLSSARRQNFAPWVTVVNDVRYSRDSAIAKDPSLIHALISDSERRIAHAIEIAERASADGFSGIHLDYEQLDSGDSLAFNAFVVELEGQLRSRGLGFEVVVEPLSGPVPDRIGQGVTVMAYDLFGVHSGPGPRSTPAFVSELGLRGSADVDSMPSLAVAVGGFVWDTGGEVEAVDWSRAHQLAATAEEARRGSEDRVPSALLPDGSALYYDDAESIASKWEAAWHAGFRRLAVWRLGGNDQNLFDLLRDLRH